MEPRSRRVKGAHGLTLHALEWSREGVLMLLVHGFGNEAHIWDDFAPCVADHYRVVALDLRGHGDSDWDAEGRYDYDDHVADLAAVLADLDAERVVLVSHSLGGRASMLFAAAHPEAMAGLVIVDSAPELDRRGITRITLDVGSVGADPSFASIAEFEATLPIAYPATAAEALHRMAVHGLRQREDGRWVLKMDPKLRGFGNRGDQTGEAQRREEASQQRLWDALEKIECPTLVVRGAASDFLSPDTADRMVEECLKKGTLAVVPQSGHSVMSDNPTGFNAAVCSFVLGE